MDQEQAACECIGYMTTIAKKMSYEGIADFEDIVSLGNDVFGSCLEKFDPEKSPDFMMYFKSRFLFAIKDWKRASMGLPCYSLDEDDQDVEDRKPTPSKSIANDEAKKILNSMIRRLNDLERQVVTMKMIDRMSQRDIAYIVGKSEARISQVFSGLMDKLKDMPEYQDLGDLLR